MQLRARAKGARLEQERRLEQVRHRVDFLQIEEARIRRDIVQIKERTKERKELATRAVAVKKVDSDTKDWASDELELRRRAVSAQRHQTRQAIEMNRLALLEARHAEFVARKLETRQSRQAVLASRATKQQQLVGRVDSVRRKQLSVRWREHSMIGEQQRSRTACATMQNARDELEVRESMQQLELLAAEEERLLNSVLRQHAQHRAEFDGLVQKLPAYRLALLQSNPAPFSLPQPLAPNSPMLGRRAETASSLARAGGGGGNPANATDSGHLRGNAAPQPIPPKATAIVTPGSRSSKRALRQAIAVGGTCMMSSPRAMSRISAASTATT